MEALRNLELRKDVIIRPADKGGAVVVMSLDKYDQGIKSQLMDTNHYTALPSNPTANVKTKIDGFIDTSLMRGFITDKEKQFLVKDHPVCPVIYGVPKIHKTLENPPLRPIVSSIGSLTEPLSQYVDHFLRTHVQNLPSYLGDTTDVLNLIQNLKCEHADIILASLDVQSLYTCIPHDAGLEAISHYLNTRPAHVLPPSAFLTDLAEIILSNNFFKYSGKYYLQCQGTAMGSAFAPSYACLVMGFWEEKFIHNSVNNTFLSKIALWRRYIDDVLLIWKGTVDELQAFLQYVNSTTRYLTFTLEFNDKEINFLDLTIFKSKDGLFDTTIYRKPLSRNTLLRANSNHSKQLIRNIPIGQYLRLRRNCSATSDFKLKAAELTNRFVERGYNQVDLDAAYHRALNTDRTSLLIKKPKQAPSRLCFSTQYTPAAGLIKNVFLKHWHILKSDPKLANICADPPLFSFRRSRSLRDRLVHSDMNAPSPPSWLPKPPQGFYKCGNCAQCSNSTNTKFFTHPRTGKKYKISSFINCNSTHVVYMLKCPCGLAYIGQTKRPLKVRIGEHKTAIRTKNLEYAMARHYLQANHGSPASLKFWGIERITAPSRGGDIINKLLRREAHWIHNLDTLEPNGLNEEMSLSCFL